MGTGLYDDPARDPWLYFINQCTTDIAVKQCFQFPNGKVSYATAYRPNINIISR